MNLHKLSHCKTDLHTGEIRKATEEQKMLKSKTENKQQTMNRTFLSISEL